MRIIPRIMLNDVCPVPQGRMGRGSLHGAGGIYPRALRWQGGSQPPGKAVVCPAPHSTASQGSP
ncbi:hypothetical protein ACGI6H_25965, partial [Escherichia coli]